jgi:hypothetical protein
MRVFLLKLAAASVPFVVMAGVNMYVDPAGIVHRGPEPLMAAMILTGRPVSGVIDFDERRLQKAVIEGLPAAPDVVVVGSSRAMSVRANWFPGARFYNASVSAAVIDDLVALTGTLDKAKRLPSQLLLFIDPWMLNANAVHTAWTVMRDERDAVLGLQKTGTEPTARRIGERFGRFAGLLSPSYFQASLRGLKAFGGRPLPRPAADAIEGFIGPDGSRTYPQRRLALGVDEVRQMAVRWATARDPYIDTFTRLDAAAGDKLKALVRFVRVRGVTVTWVLAPFHPRAYDLLASSADRRLMVEAEPAIRAIGVELNVDVVGSFDPRRCSCDERDFLDGAHPLESCTERIVNGRVRRVEPGGA